jgi:GNAT superfamily N-acetyltransferase
MSAVEPYSIHSYEPRHAARVADLLARSRRERRRKCPLLPAGLDDAATAARFLEDPGPGVVALAQDGSLAGFLFAERRVDPIWGASVVVDPDRCALAPGVDVRLLARLYAAGFDPLAPGVGEHRVHSPSFDADMLQAWFQLGFGMEQAYAAARLEDMDEHFAATGGLEIRRAGGGDEEILAGLSPLIATMQARSPVWAGAPASYLAALREGFQELATDPEAIVLLAFRGARAVGYQAWFPAASHPVDGRAEGAVELSAGATIPEERGTGVGRALTARGVSEARAAGYSACFADWRTTNPLSSGFWPARGFRTYLYRLVRRIDPVALGVDTPGGSPR